MSALPPRQYKQFNRNFSAFRKETPEATIRELQQAAQELQEAVIELQQLQVRSRSTDATGLPEHGSRCEVLDGQFLHITQTAAAPSVILVEHGLRRVPQAAVWLLTGNSNNQMLIAGEVTNKIAPATETKVSVRLNGSVGDKHICIIF